jgi:hypothetical protein
MCHNIHIPASLMVSWLFLENNCKYGQKGKKLLLFDLQFGELLGRGLAQFWSLYHWAETATAT